MAEKTRCKKCFYKNAKVTQEPCNKCSEIHAPYNKFENHFLEDIRNLMKEE